MTYRDLMHNILKLPVDTLDQQVAVILGDDIYAVRRILITGENNPVFEPGHVCIEVQS